MLINRFQRGFAHLLAVLIVVFVVGVVALAYILIFKPNFSSSNQIASLPIPVKPQATLSLTVDQPQDQTLVNNPVITVSGKSLPNVTVAFFDDTDSNSVVSDSNGNFSGDLTLAEGINTITVTVFDGDGNENSTKINLVYDKSVK